MSSDSLPASLRTNIKFIDEQHAALLQVADEIIDLINSAPDREKIEDLVGFLKSYTINHFKEEEELMLSKKYIEYEAHKKEHDYFNYYIQTVSDDLAKITDVKDITSDVIESLRDWIVEHVHKTDIKMAEYVRSY